MKKIVAFVTAILMLVACNNTVKVSKDFVELKSEQEFIEKVFDFTQYPQSKEFKGDKPCVVEIYTEGCKPCNIMSQRLDSLLGDYVDEVNFYRMNGAEASKLMYFFEIQEFPTILFCNKYGISKEIGLQTKTFLKEKIDNLLHSPSETIVTEETNENVITELTTQEFRTKVFDFVTNPNVWKFEGNKPCVVDFYADWCKPCKMLSPTMESLAEKYAGKVDFYKVNIDNAQDLAMYLNIQSIPAIMYCKKEFAQGDLGINEKDHYIMVIDSLLLN